MSLLQWITEKIVVDLNNNNKPYIHIVKQISVMVMWISQKTGQI